MFNKGSSKLSCGNINVCLFYTEATKVLLGYLSYDWTWLFLFMNQVSGFVASLIMGEVLDLFFLIPFH